MKLLLGVFGLLLSGCNGCRHDEAENRASERAKLNKEIDSLKREMKKDIGRRITIDSNNTIK